MSFPQTQLTLIQKLASEGSEEDWCRFLRDYHGPICRFALRFGAGNLDEAEDIASQTFEVLWESRLLARWVVNRAAKLRSLLCGIVRKILANRERVRAGRERLEPELLAHFERLANARDSEVERFYAAWVEDVVQKSVEAMAMDYYSSSKGDYVRVFYGRLCQGLSLAQLAESLQLSAAQVDHYFRHARDRLSKKLEELVREQVLRYCGPDEAGEEVAGEWARLGQYLREHGGLEQAVEQAYGLLDPLLAERPAAGVSRAMNRLTAIMHRSSVSQPPGNGRD